MNLLRHGQQAVDRAVSLHVRALDLEERGQPHEALLLASEASRWMRSAGCARQLDIANVLLCSSRLHRVLGQPAEALAGIRECLAILECLPSSQASVPLQPSDTDRLWIRANIIRGQLESDTGDYQAAVRTLRCALHRAREVLKPHDLDVVGAASALGVVCKYTGQFEAAEDLYHQALRALELRFEPEAEAVSGAEAGSGAGSRLAERASLLHNLGGLEHARGNFQRAEPYAREALALRQQLVGSEHLETAAERAALAAILADSGRLAEARALYLSANEVFERILGSKHYEVAVNLAGLAAVEQACGHFAEAEALYRRSVALHLLQLGPNHPETALTLNNHGTLLVELQRLDEAEQVLHQAREVLEATLGLDHPHCQACYANLLAMGASTRPAPATPLASIPHP